ncbi:Uncharacterized protein SCF082_LOCUS53469 [Durusdinium trenchii]|uniref:Uncharacterized protein n=1 Tax=Durusdinium trenchii TaxID=1381693 RepID=A0ABP0SSW6_9DINO
MALSLPGGTKRGSIFNRVYTTVVGPDGTSTADISLGQRKTLADEVKEACHKLGLVSDGPLEESFVLTIGHGAGSVIATKGHLSKYLEQSNPEKLHCRKVSEVAMSLVASLEAPSETAREKAYLQLLKAVKNEYLLYEVICKRNGIQVALREAQATQCRTRPPLALVCSLLNDDNAEDWLDERQDCKELGIQLFRYLLVAIFEDGADPSICHLCLTIVMSLLQKLPSLQDVVNQVIQEEREKEEKGEVSPVASNLSIDDDDEHDASFQSCAANLLLASLQEDDPKLQEERYDNLLVAYTGACTELASAAVAGTSSSAPEELVKLERRIEHLQGLNRKLKAQLRLKWAAMIKMAKFVFVDDDVIDRSLEPVIRIGWDGFKWNKGYSLLHYAADCVTDPEAAKENKRGRGADG